jgi:NlpE N-terminal domain
MRARALPLRLLMLCWLGVPACASWLAVGGETDVSGIYQGRAPAADAAKRVFTLNLAADGTATLNTLYIGKDETSQHGHWMQSGHQVVMTFDAMGPNRPGPRPITFRYRDHALKPIHWDSSEWGRAGPPVLHRSRAVQGGF